MIAALFLPAAYASLVELLSRPKPISLEWKHGDLSEAVVLGANLREGKSIYLWLRMAGLDEPRAYVLPWDQKLAQQLHDAQREAESQGTAVHMNRPFESSYDNRRRLFYAMPQPPQPPKEIPSQGPLQFRP